MGCVVECTLTKTDREKGITTTKSNTTSSNQQRNQFFYFLLAFRCFKQPSSVQHNREHFLIIFIWLFLILWRKILYFCWYTHHHMADCSNGRLCFRSGIYGCECACTYSFWCCPSQVVQLFIRVWQPTTAYSYRESYTQAQYFCFTPTVKSYNGLFVLFVRTLFVSPVLCELLLLLFYIFIS